MIEKCQMSKDTSSNIELVITAPVGFERTLAYDVGARSTLGVLVELFAASTERVVIAAPFLQFGYGASGGTLEGALNSAVYRGVNVDIVSTGLGLSTVQISNLEQNARGKIRLFRPSANLADEAIIGSHAKFCVADMIHAYIGSANLTGAGLSGHLELGVLVHGDVAKRVSDFWLHCVDVGLFVCVCL